MVLAALFAVFELISLDLVFAMLALGAFAAGVAGLLGAPLWLQIGIGTLVAAACLGIIRPKAKAKPICWFRTVQ